MTDDSMSDEDKALFRAHMRSVKPLNEKTQRIKSQASAAPQKAPANRSRPPSSASQSSSQPTRPLANKEYFLSDFISDTVLSHTLLSYADSSITGKRFRELKNGLIPWEARLDLHGMKTEAARHTLCQFIQNQNQSNKRCLLIIHGKGGHEGAPPVIKNLINRWLPQFDEVLAFHSALPKDGGHGAVYVLLKKNRGE